MTTPPPLTDDEVADLNRRLDTLFEDANTQNFKDIEHYKTDHQNFMREKFFGFIRQFEMYFSAMVDYSNNINYLDKKDWPINRAFQFIIITNALKQLNSAYGLLLDGAYEDAISLLRSAYESFLRIIYVSCNPTTPYNAYTMKGQTGVKFNATNLVKDDLKLGWTTYVISSVFLHSNQYKVSQTMIEIGINKMFLKIELMYEQDDKMLSIVTNFISFLLTVYLKSYDELFVVDIEQHNEKDKIQPHLDKLHEYAEISYETLAGHTASEYWRESAVDIGHIFKLIKTMDNDPSLVWKEVWDNILNETS